MAGIDAITDLLRVLRVMLMYGSFSDVVVFPLIGFKATHFKYCAVKEQRSHVASETTAISYDLEQYTFI